jgi:hypothetical protein
MGEDTHSSACTTVSYHSTKLRLVVRFFARNLHSNLYPRGEERSQVLLFSWVVSAGSLGAHVARDARRVKRQPTGRGATVPCGFMAPSYVDSAEAAGTTLIGIHSRHTAAHHPVVRRVCMSSLRICVSRTLSGMEASEKVWREGRFQASRGCLCVG